MFHHDSRHDRVVEGGVEQNFRSFDTPGLTYFGED